ncbi:hypothetical protein JCM10550A_08330 [Methanogenium cariaci]
MFHAILSDGRVSLMDHVAYLEKELYKAELALCFGRSFEPDGECPVRCSLLTGGVDDECRYRAFRDNRGAHAAQQKPLCSALSL